MAIYLKSALWPGVPLALSSATLFGVSTPLSKLLLGTVDPQLLAGLLYLGAGIGLAAVHGGRALLGIPAAEAPLRPADTPWLAAVVLFGGVLGPLLLMLGLNRTTASSGSLLLNLEWLATMGMAWLVFKRTSIVDSCQGWPPYWRARFSFRGKGAASSSTLAEL